MSRMQIALGGSAADPPHRGHYALLEKMLNLNRFDLVIWIVSGFRKDKKNLIDPDHRVAMTELMIPHEWRLRSGTNLIVRYDDVYGENTPTITYLERTQEAYPDADIFWFTGVDSVEPQDKYQGCCQIETKWFRGPELMKDWNFLIVNRVGFKTPEVLPPNFELLDFHLPSISSSEIRQRIITGGDFEELLFPDVAEYIRRHGLYGYQKVAHH